MRARSWNVPFTRSWPCSDTRKYVGLHTLLWPISSGSGGWGSKPAIAHPVCLSAQLSGASIVHTHPATVGSLMYFVVSRMLIVTERKL